MSDQHWTEPGTFEVDEGVHRIPLPLPMDGLRAVNVYALETEQGLTLVDGGWAIEAARQRLDASLASIGHRVADITRILVTHAHRDHYTQAVAVRREVGAHVSLGLGDRDSLAMMTDRDAPDPFGPRLVRGGAGDLARSWSSYFEARDGSQSSGSRSDGSRSDGSRSDGSGRPDPRDWEPPDAWLDGDQRLEVGSRTLAAVPTPGHTRGHYVFADLAGGLLFAGDHVLPTITPSIGFEPAAAEQPLGDFLTSLAKVRALPDLRLLPAHGAVTPSSHARVDELVAHHEERLALCAAAVGSGSCTAYDVAAELPWTRHQKSLADLGVFDASLAVMETLAHLELLAARGGVTRAESDGVLEYALPR